MNKKLLQKVAIVSVAALIAMPNLVIPTNSYASNVIGPAGGSLVSEGNRTIAGDNSDVAIPDGDYTGKAYNSTYTGAGYAISEADIKRHIKKNKNPNNPAKYYNDLGKGKYFRDSNSGNIYTADGGSKYLQTLVPTEGEWITKIDKWGQKVEVRNPNYDPSKVNQANTIDNSRIYEAVEKAVFLLNNPGTSYNIWGSSYAAQKYKVYMFDGRPAWVDRNKDNWEYNIFGEKCYPAVVKQFPFKWAYQWSQGSDIIYYGWDLVHHDKIEKASYPWIHNMSPDWQPNMSSKDDMFIYTCSLNDCGDYVEENYGSATAPLEALRLQVEQAYMNMK